MNKDRNSAIAAIMTANNLGIISFLTLPFWLGAVIESYGIGEGAAGKIPSFELGVMTLMTLILSPRVHRINRKMACRIGVLLSAIGNVSSMFAPDVGWLIGARIIAGLGQGILAAMASSTAATTYTPQRTFALIAFAQTGFWVLAVTLAPSLIKMWGAKGIFAMMAAVSLLGLPLFNWLPLRKTSGGAPAGKMPITKWVIIALMGLAILQTGDAMIWTYLERIGLNTGLSLQSVGAIIGASSVVCLLGPVLARVLGTRLGIALPISTGLFMIACSALTLAHASTPTIYTIGTVGLPVAILFCNPYIMAILAALDDKGRVAATAPAFSGIGNAIGPAAGGMVLTMGNGYPSLGWTASCLYIVSAACLISAAHCVDRRRKAEAVSSMS